MSEKEPELIVTDRRKFRANGEPTGVTTPQKAGPAPETPAANNPAVSNLVEMHPKSTPETSAPESAAPAESKSSESKSAEFGNEEAAENSFTAPTDDQISATHSAYHASTRQLDEVIAAANPGSPGLAEMNFSRLVQSIYMTAMLQLGAVAQESQQPRVDILGARQSVDMLGILSDKTQGNLSPEESSLLSTALFDLRMAFLEITQSIARSATQQGTSPISGPGGPNLIR